jgi:hypothetical protein
MAGNNDFCLIWVPARGHSGGLITGVKNDDFELEELALEPFSWLL